ncbi:MAG: Activator of Hsp90 ATPase 1 family protein [Ferruginibacter sp.]|nr:Activator of Hsp90 ATPase 1 family protein [Ferruginibacter sp.]
MIGNTPLDMVVDKATKTVSFSREFDADLALVWDAFTKQEILDQWWAPKPWSSKTRDMNFETGGRRFYAMVGPDGQARWQSQQYTSINPKTNFKMYCAFADENEQLELPGSDWTLNFSENDGRTTVSISIYNESLPRLEKMLEMGFREGSAMIMQNLEDILKTMSEK